MLRGSGGWRDCLEFAEPYHQDLQGRTSSSLRKNLSVVAAITGLAHPPRTRRRPLGPQLQSKDLRGRWGCLLRLYNPVTHRLLDPKQYTKLGATQDYGRRTFRSPNCNSLHTLPYRNLPLTPVTYLKDDTWPILAGPAEWSGVCYSHNVNKVY